jgi:radical SAM protein with 4Fe4S-binding SPASM domain
MKSKLKIKILNFISEHHLISPSLTRFPIPDTFWKAGLHRITFRLANYYFTHYLMLRKKSRVVGYPSHLTIDVTNVCNLRCPLCPTGVNAPGRGKGAMPLETFRKIIDEMGRYLISVDLFNWGEPLLNNDVYEMIAYAHKRNIVTSISSNFQHFSAEAAERLVSSGLDNLILSIDGASQESYEKYRVGGDFQKTVNNISLLVKAKKERGAGHPYIYWQYLVMKHNEHEMEIARKLAEELGVDKITFDHAYLPVNTRQEAMKWLPEDPKNHRYDMEHLRKMWAEHESRDENQKEASSVQQDFRRRVNCSWLWTQTTINWDGSVSPCCAIYEPSHDFGNVTNSSFKQVWNNDKYRASRRFSSTGETCGTETICMRCPLAMHG